MKKLLIVTNVFWVLIALFLLFHCCKNKNGIAAQSSIDSCTRTMYKDYSTIPLEGLIDGNLIAQLSQSYASDKGKAFINYSGKSPQSEHLKLDSDAFSVCVDLEKIKNFIWHIENAACANNCDTKHIFGIRIYYVKYPERAQTVALGLPASYAHKHTVVLVPVYKNNGTWYDFDYSQTIGSNCSFISIDTANHKNKGLLLGREKSPPSDNSNGDNHGDLGPPPGTGIYPTNQPQQQ